MTLYAMHVHIDTDDKHLKSCKMLTRNFGIGHGHGVPKSKDVCLELGKDKS